MEINATIIGQLLTFLLLVWFTMKYVWPPITNAILVRERKIADGLEAAIKSQRELEMAEQKSLSLIQQAKEEGLQIIDAAHKRATQLLEEAKLNSKEEAKRIVKLAHEETSREMSQAKEALRKKLGSLAIAGAEKIIKQHLDEKIHEALISEFVAKL